MALERTEFAARQGPEAVAAAVDQWLTENTTPSRGVAIVASPSAEALGAVFRLLERDPLRRRLLLGERFARELLRRGDPRRPLDALDALDRALDGPSGVLLLDRIEALFAPEHSLRVLDALQSLARTRTFVVAWSLPSVEACQIFASARVLLYATEAHPEHVRAFAGNLPVWCVG